MTTAVARIGRAVGIVALALGILGGVAGLVASAVVEWRVIPNHRVAILASVVTVPLFLWGLTRDE